MRFKDNINIVHKKYEIWSAGDNQVKFFLKNSIKNSKLNKLLNQYPADTKFTLSDEALFYLDIKEIKLASQVAEIIGVNSNVFELVP